MNNKKNNIDNNQLKINFSVVENKKAKIISIDHFDSVRNQKITSMILKNTKSF